MLAPLALAFALAAQPPKPVVHRTEGNVRAIFNAAHRWLVLLVDASDPTGTPPDGEVEIVYHFEDLDGQWPLGDRWEGSATIAEYALDPAPRRVGIGITTPSGIVQLFYRPVAAPAIVEMFRDPGAIGTATFHDADTRTSGSVSFDEAEREAVRFAELVFNTRQTAATTPGSASAPIPTPTGSATQPIRVGGAIRVPQKIVDAPPDYPAIAQSGRVQGVVILEIVVGTDGSVTDAKILRSIPLLDQAALDCVRKWKFETTQLNGTPVPVIMTVTVNFALQ